MSAACKSCDAPIRWVRLRPGLKPHPVDETPKKVIVLSEVGVVAVIDNDAPVAKMVDGYTSHFATCPDADDWRGLSK